MNIRNLRAVHATDKSVLNGFIDLATPVVINGLAERWEGIKWNFHTLKDIIGDKEVRALTNLPATGGKLDGGHGCYERVMSFGCFVDLAHDEHAKPCYLGYVRYNELFDDIKSYFLFEKITENYSGGSDTRFWIGSKGTCSGLHSDLKDNLFLQVHGYKTVYLVPFEDTPYVYPYLDNIVNSRIDCENFLLSEFPLFTKARVYKVTVSPGDLMFIPKGWWHYISSSTPSISVNHWFGQPILGSAYCKMLVRLGPSYVIRTLRDMLVYSIAGKTYKKEFFFTPQSTGERLFNYLTSGDFSKENNPVNS